MTNEEFGQRFKAARKATGLTQVEAAAKLGLDQGRISDYERGQFTPHLPKLMEIITTLGLDPEVIFPEFWPARQKTRPGRTR